MERPAYDSECHSDGNGVRKGGHFHLRELKNKNHPISFPQKISATPRKIILSIPLTIKNKTKEILIFNVFPL